MRIALDARMMGPLSTRGIGRYVEELVRAMVRQTDEHRFVLFVRDPETSPFVGNSRVEHIRADVPWYGLREQFEMSRFFREAKADLVHVPHWNVPLAMREPFVMTIHDLLLRHDPHSSKASTKGPLVAFAKRAGFRVILAQAIKHARTILVPTQFVADDVAEKYQISSTKSQTRIVVTGEGVTEFPDVDPSIVPSHPYLLSVGSAYPHKRLDLLLEGWKELSKRYPHLHLVIVGEEDVFMARYVAKVKCENLPRVLFTGRINDAKLAALYDGATAFVFPSSFEGFGLPPIEALSRGCPVISSDAACMPEVLTRFGVQFFRSGDLSAMIGAIDTVLRSSSAHKASTMAMRSSVAQVFSWESAAARTLSAYARALSS